MKKTAEPSFNVIRAVSTVSIVLFHYSYVFHEYAINGNWPDLPRLKNSDVGGVFVAVFFMLSGAALLYNHPSFNSLSDIAAFYKKRWLSLFPMFYIAWCIMYVINSLREHDWFWGGPRRNFLLSFIGMDGYFMYRGKNYYCLGEWFLGGIIIMYLLYPLLVFLWNRARLVSSSLILFLFCFNPRRHYFSSAPDTNIFIVLIKYYNSHIVISDNMCIWTCLLNFWLGFVLVTYLVPAVKKRVHVNPLFPIVVIIAMLPFFFIELPLQKIESRSIMALLCYILLTLLTNTSTSLKPLDTLINIISRYSYGIFLLHHVMLYGIMYLVKNFTFNLLSSLIFFVPLFTLILLCAVLLTRASAYMTSAVNSLFNALFRRGEEA